MKNLHLVQNLVKWTLVLTGNWNVRQKILRVVEKPSPEHSNEGKVNMVEILALSIGCKFD